MIGDFFMWLGGFLFGMLLGAISMYVFEKPKIKETVRQRCVDALKSEANNYYQMEKKAPNKLMGRGARASALIYSQAAMLLQEMEIK